MTRTKYLLKNRTLANGPKTSHSPGRPVGLNALIGSPPSSTPSVCNPVCCKVDSPKIVLTCSARGR